MGNGELRGNRSASSQRDLAGNQTGNAAAGYGFLEASASGRPTQGYSRRWFRAGLGIRLKRRRCSKGISNRRRTLAQIPFHWRCFRRTAWYVAAAFSNGITGTRRPSEMRNWFGEVYWPHPHEAGRATKLGEGGVCFTATSRTRIARRQRITAVCGNGKILRSRKPTQGKDQTRVIQTSPSSSERQATELASLPRAG